MSAHVELPHHSNHSHAESDREAEPQHNQPPLQEVRPQSGFRITFKDILKIIVLLVLVWLVVWMGRSLLSESYLRSRKPASLASPTLTQVPEVVAPL